jgi:hypothetical protein
MPIVAATKGKGRGNKNVSANQQQDSKEGVSEKLTHQAVENSKKFKNGISPNPNCSFSYEELALILAKVQERKAECSENIKIIKDRISDNGDDGGVKSEDNFNSGKCVELDTLNELKGHENCLDKLGFVERQIRSGDFSNICIGKKYQGKNKEPDECRQRIPLERILFVPDTNYCSECQRAAERKF